MSEYGCDLNSVEPGTARALEVIAGRAQRDGRVPGLLAVVARRGRVHFSVGIGRAHVDDPTSTPDLDTPYLIASNTKTFVAATILSLRDEGRLSLDATLSTYLPTAAHGRSTLRSLLSHVSGLQREPAGDVWDTLTFPDREALLSGLAAAQFVGTPHTRWHYSNLAYCLLGQVIEAVDGGDWYASVRRRLLDPLGLADTHLGPPPPGSPRRLAGTYVVPPYSDVPLPEPVVDPGATAPAGGLVSTARDLARWGAFLADPDPAVLAVESVEAMCAPVALLSDHDWTAAYGLGVMSVRRGARTWVGHTGGLPGAITGVFTDRDSGVTALVFMNHSDAPSPAALAVELGEALLDREPEPPRPWEPGEALPAQFAPLLGVWFSEGHRFVFSVRHGELQARADHDDPQAPPSRFVDLGGDTYRTVSGPETGELLQVHRDPDGAVRRLHWATYPFTRDPLPFGAAAPGASTAE